MGRARRCTRRLETATGAQEDPLSIIISTQAPTDNDLLSVLIDDADKGGDPKTRLFMFTAPPDADPFAEKTIKKANPAFGEFQNKTEVLAMAEDARRMPSREAEYRNLILNQRVEPVNPFITKTVWQGCGDPVIESFEGLPVYGGLDLSATSDLTALVLIAPHEQKWHVKPTFWLPEEGLRERARQDRVEYDLWHSAGLPGGHAGQERRLPVRRRVSARAVRQARHQEDRLRPLGVGALP